MPWMTKCNVVSSLEVIHVNVCHHGDEELFEVPADI